MYLKREFRERLKKIRNENILFETLLHRCVFDARLEASNEFTMLLNDTEK